MVFLLVFVGSFFSCNEKTEDQPVNCPMEVSFTEFSLKGTSCYRTSLNHDNGVIIINSRKKLENHFNCLDDSYLEVDFSKYTLLLMSGSTNWGICNITKKVLQLSANNYRINVVITLNDATIAQGWSLALIVNKISNNSRVELNVTTIRN